MTVLVVNAGSSSLKLALLDPAGTVLAKQNVRHRNGRLTDDEVRAAIAETAAAGGTEVRAVGHRVVHGGPDYTSAVLVDDQVRARLNSLVELAPLHQPAALAGIDAVREALPDVPNVACFDTAFHAHLPAAAATYPLPEQWRERWPIRRYGFHGLSYAYASRRAAQLVDRAGLRMVLCHLGAGASACAVAGGRSVDTTMGFTPLEGLVMATRSGSLDPGLVLWLVTRQGMSPDALTDALEHESGLLGLAGTADLREVVDRAPTEPAARLALDVYVHRLRSAIAALTASLGGLDVLVFTGGVGENAPTVRALAAAGLEYLGVAVDQGSNAVARADANISADGARVQTLVVTAREDVQIADETRQVLGLGP